MVSFPKCDTDQEPEQTLRKTERKQALRDWGGPVVKTLPCNAGDVGLIPGWGARTPQALQKRSPSGETTDSEGHD